MLYAANVSGPVDTLLDRAAAAVEAGATAIMVNAFATGIDAVRAVAAAGLGVPVLAHRVGAGPIVRNPEVGVDGAVLCELTRIAGADLVQIGGFGGKLFDTDDEVARNLAACRRPLAGARVPVPVNGGGRVGRVDPDRAGRRRPRRHAAARAWAPTSTPAAPKPAPAACKQAIDAVTAGQALEDAAAGSAPRNSAAALAHSAATDAMRRRSDSEDGRVAATAPSG